MIYEALVAPHEQPPTLREIKRALLTFDKVVLVDPADRELIPRNSFMSTLMGLPLFGMDTGPVRPIGKSIGYDDRFERTVETCKPAVEQGLLEVRGTYSPAPRDQFTIGAVKTGGYPLDTAAVYRLYRAMAGSQDYLQAALSDQVQLLEAELEANAEVAQTGQADGSVNDGPSLPTASAVASHQNSEALTLIARARVASLIKHAGYCEAKGIVPLFNSAAFGPLVRVLFERTRSFLAAGDEIGEYIRRSRVLELAHQEFLVDERLDSLSVQEVIGLRTSAWGKQASAREALFQSIYRIANDSAEATDFEQKALEAIRQYRVQSEELIRERASLSVSIKCDLGVTTLGGGVAAAGYLSQIESPLPSIAVTLAVGTMWALERAKEYVPKLKEIQAQTSELSRGAGLALHNYYGALPGAASQETPRK
jgi:hypothetical protein